jgi:predicted PurR-regulated permease PerM
MQERYVEFRVRTILRLLAILFAAFALYRVFQLSQSVISWILIALLLALALDPFVSWIEQRARLGRAAAIGVAYLVLLLAIAGIGVTFVPSLVEAVEEGGAARALGLSGKALEITRGVVAIVVAAVTILFLSFFMLLEGRRWVELFYSLLPEHSQDRWRGIGADIHRTVSGYVTGNLLLSLIAGASASLVLLIMGVPFAVALGLLVAVLDLIPLAGATIAGVVVVGISFIHSIPAGIVLLVFIVLYQQLENHFLQPVVYGRTVQLSPLVVLIAILLGASIAGILGALAAIPVAGSLQVVLRDVFASRRAEPVTSEPAT